MRPYLVTYPDGMFIVADFAFEHRDGGLCFVSICWDDNGNTHSPFHILAGPVWHTEGGWRSSEGATIRQLTPRDEAWQNWLEWCDHKASTDFPNGDWDQHAIECCRRDGAIGDPL